MPIDDGQKSKMSINSSGYDKSIEKINIFIKKCKNLVSLRKLISLQNNDIVFFSYILMVIFCSQNTQGRPEGLTLYAKIDFNESSIGESQKILVTADNVPDLNFNSSLSVNTSDQTSLDDIAYKPVIGIHIFLYSYIKILKIFT